MSQNVMTKQLALEPAEEAIANQTGLVDSYAERLMDELFEDVDRALDSSAGLPTEPVQAEFVSLKPIAVPQIILPTPSMPSQEDSIDTEAIARHAILVAKKQQAKQSFDRILLGAAFASLLLTLGLWLASRSGMRRFVVSTPTVSASQAATEAKAEADAQFGIYMQQALDALDQKKATQPKLQNPNLPGAPVTTNLPAIPVPGSPPPTAGLAQAINRVADAIQQVSAQPGTPPTQVVIVPPAAAPKTASSSASPTTSGVLPTTPAIPRTSVAPVTPSATAASPEAAPSSGRILAREPERQPEAAPEASTAPQPAESTPAESSPASEAPTTIHTLVGILELGDRSAALFEIEGVARRIYVGESIGASGWTLAEVKNQEAVIRKGGEVRSIFVGQKF
ncbi:hypothetical protein [Phormidium nigroviride]